MSERIVLVYQLCLTLYNVLSIITSSGVSQVFAFYMIFLRRWIFDWLVYYAPTTSVCTSSMTGTTYLSNFDKLVYITISIYSHHR